MADEPELLRVPNTFRSVDDLLATARQMGLSNAVLISERENGALVFLNTDLSLAQCNWLCDRMKTLMLMPEAFQRRT